MLERSKRPIWHCRRLREDEDGYSENPPTFAPPKMLRINFRGTSGEAELIAAGSVIGKHLVCKLPVNLNPFEEKDRCYVYDPPPDEHDILCRDAKYYVASVRRSQNVAEVILERNS